MAKFDKKLESFGLRRKGWSIGDISKHLKVSKSSVSVWCRDLVLSESQRKQLIQKVKIAGHVGRQKGADMNRNKRLDSIKAGLDFGKKILESLDKNSFLSAGVSLYWAEGYKKGSQIAFSNSDPAMINFMANWFKEFFHVKNADFLPRVFINSSHINRIDNVLDFWSNLIRIPKSQFGNPVFINVKQKKVYENHDSYYGVLSLGIRKSSKLKYNVIGLIEALKQCRCSSTVRTRDS